jgi:hypothetical protein
VFELLEVKCSIFSTFGEITLCVVKAKLSQYLTSCALTHEDVWGSGCRDERFPGIDAN